MSDTIITSIISSISTLLAVVVTLWFSKRNETLLDTKNKLIQDWLFFHKEEEIIIGEISKIKEKSSQTLKIEFRANIETELHYKLNYKPSEILKLTKK